MPVKLIIITEELLRATAFFQRELQIALARATNSVFLPLLVPGSSFAASGTNALGVRQDLRTLLAAVNSGADSRLFLITTRTVAEALAVMGDSAGGPAFPLASVGGGTVDGIPIVICDEVTTGEIILVDASAVAAGQDGLVLDSTREATLQSDTVPDSPPGAATPVISLWQNDMVALRAERFIGAKLLRSDACAKITGAGYTGGSPSF
jgi:HK97 family phage major capsid protein